MSGCVKIAENAEESDGRTQKMIFKATLYRLKRLMIFKQNRRGTKKSNKITEENLLRNRKIPRKINKRAHTAEEKCREQYAYNSFCLVA